MSHLAQRLQHERESRLEQADDLDSRIEAAAQKEADQAASAFTRQPRDYAAQNEYLYDLRLTTARIALQLSGANAPEELVWQIARDLPAYDVSPLYQSRASIIALACAVTLGWIMGGILSTLLGLIGLGGEIIRPALIVVFLWLEEFFGANPRARKAMLAVLGLGALGRFAAALASGVVRIASLGSIRQLIFGAGIKRGFFKSVWLWLGAIFLLIFFSRRSSGIDLRAFKESMTEQISQRLRLLILFFRELGEYGARLARLEESDSQDSPFCPRKDCALASAALSLLGQLQPDQAAWLAAALERTGYKVHPDASAYLIWDSGKNPAEYDTVGLVKDGDRCLILKPAWSVNGVIHKGLVQRVPGE